MLKKRDTHAFFCLGLLGPVLALVHVYKPNLRKIAQNHKLV